MTNDTPPSAVPEAERLEEIRREWEFLLAPDYRHAWGDGWTAALADLLAALQSRDEEVARLKNDLRDARRAAKIDNESLVKEAERADAAEARVASLQVELDAAIAHELELRQIIRVDYEEAKARLAQANEALERITTDPNVHTLRLAEAVAHTVLADADTSPTQRAQSAEILGDAAHWINALKANSINSRYPMDDQGMFTSLAKFVERQASALAEAKKALEQEKALRESLRVQACREHDALKQILREHEWTEAAEIAKAALSDLHTP